MSVDLDSKIKKVSQTLDKSKQRKIKFKKLNQKRVKNQKRIIRPAKISLKNLQVKNQKNLNYLLKSSITIKCTLKKNSEV